MASNVVGLRGATVAGTREPDANVIAALEMLLAKARDGRLHGVGFVTVTDDTVSTGWAGGACRHYMLAGAARLQYRMAEDYENAEV